MFFFHRDSVFTGSLFELFHHSFFNVTNNELGHFLLSMIALLEGHCNRFSRSAETHVGL